MTQQLVLRETGFYLQDPNLGGGSWKHSCSEPSCLSTSLASPMSLSVLKSATQTDLHLLWKVHLWVPGSPSSGSSSLLQDLGYVVLSLHAVVQGNMCRVTLGHGGVQGGAGPKRVASLYVRQSSRNLQLSIPSHSSAPSISHESMLS